MGGDVLREFLDCVDGHPRDLGDLFGTAALVEVLLDGVEDRPDLDAAAVGERDGEVSSSAGSTALGKLSPVSSWVTTAGLAVLVSQTDLVAPRLTQVGGDVLDRLLGGGRQLGVGRRV